MKKIISSFVFIVFAAILPAIAQINEQASNPVKKPLVSEPASGKQTEAMEKVVRDYLLKNPVVIREAMQALQEREEKEKDRIAAGNIKDLGPEIYSDSESPALGSKKSDISIVVFFDYLCGYCKKTLPELQTLLAKDSSLRIIYKEFPILGPQSQTAARAALAAGRQGKFAEFHQALLESNGVSEDEIKELSGRLRLDYAALQRDMNDPKIIAAIDRNIRLAASLNINGTPAYLIGSRVIPGAIDFDSLITIIKAERVKLSAKQ